MNGDEGRLWNIKNVKRVVEYDLNWVMITTGYKNECWGDECIPKIMHSRRKK